MKQCLLVFLAVFVPFLTWSADIPPNQLRSQEYDRAACIQKQRDDCVNTICPVSAARDCAEQCQKTAEARCQVAS